MKNQYFGDINDYYKYSFLRLLTDHGRAMSLGVCWMLTPDFTNNKDGHHRRYLQEDYDFRDRWSEKDGVLYSRLRPSLDTSFRHIVQARHRDILGFRRTRFFETPFSHQNRHSYMKEAGKALADCNLIFFDPDNGWEPKSADDKHLLLEEAKMFSSSLSKTHTIVVIQFLNKGSSYEGQIERHLEKWKFHPYKWCIRIRKEIGGRCFFVYSHERNLIQQRLKEVVKVWNQYIEISDGSPANSRGG